VQQLTTLLTTRFRIIALTLGLTLVTSVAASAQTRPPDGWLDANIGSATGAISYGDDGSITVIGSGTDIWGTADSFHYSYQVLNGDGEFRARVISVNGPQDWTKAGLMIRQSLDPGSPHQFVLASKGKGLHYQRRLAQGGTSLSTSLAFPTTAIWYRVVRTGAQVELSMSSDGVNWTHVGTATWPTGPTYVGFAVTSHDSSTDPVAFGRFDDVAVTGNERSAPTVTVNEPAAGDSIPTGQAATIRWQANSSDADTIAYFNVYHGVEQSGVISYEPIAECARLAGNLRSCTWTSPGPPSDAAHVLVMAVDAHNDQGIGASGRFSIEQPQTGTLPSGWSDQDIGAVSVNGSAGFDGTSFTVNGSGADIWGTVDAFHFAYTQMSGDFTITARVTSVENVDQWTKAGLMIRESLSPDSRHGSFFATPSTAKGTAFQSRDGAGNSSFSVTGPDVAPPVWLKLVKRGRTITAYFRHNTIDLWSQLQYEVFDSFADTVDVGLAVSSHLDGQVATAQFSDVVVESLPPWQMQSIGTSQGFGSTDSTIFGLAGGGSDIWGTADAFEYASVPWIGDGTITARVRGLEDTSPWAKAGVMFRESLTTNSKHVFFLVSAERGSSLQYRAATGGQSAEAAGGSGYAPSWLRLTRTGDQFTAQISFDGTTWTPIGGVTVPMSQSLYVGIAHTSHNTSDYGESSFDDLRVTR
jgi:regulation of enolase protein 1 (concanavalin A-like superfamily)